MTDADKIISQLRIAANTSTYHGLIQTLDDAAYMHRCTRTAQLRSGTRLRLIFTRDAGHHAVGWWKNPDYDRCFHLSVSFSYRDTTPAPFDKAEAQRWAKLFYGNDTRWVWVEPPYSAIGKLRGVHHYRLFTDPGWQPMKPRGEVYTKDFTEKGWKSFSELHGEAVALRYDPPMGFVP